MKVSGRVGRRILALKGGAIILGRPARQLLLRPFDIGSPDSLKAAGAGFDDTGVDGAAFARVKP